MGHARPVTRPALPLQGVSLAHCRAAFGRLAPPPSLIGVFRAAFTGPAWLRAIAGPGLWPLGLGGWWGKTFDSAGQGFNLVRRGGQLQPRLPIRLSHAASRLDGQPCLAVAYAATAPFPWRWVVDEIRQLDAEVYLGMTLAALPGVRGQALPFLLFAAADLTL